MNTDFSKLKTPNEICHDIAGNIRARRKDAKLSQQRMSQKSGVSLGSLKRFEATGEISLSSLVKLAFALGCEDDLQSLFAKMKYQSIQEIIDEHI
jgi:transcriptional regulator with XRE-family HTH domain